MSKQPPPALARWLLRMQPLGARRAEIEADLEELYEVRLQDRGHRHAKWRYYRDVLSLWRAPGEPQTDPANRTGAHRGKSLDIVRDLTYAGRMWRRALRGRTYTGAEVRDRARVAVVSEALARDFFSGEDPIGRPLSRVVEDEGDALIIGVVSNAITTRLRERSEAAIYLPVTDWRSASLLIRTASSPSLHLATIRSALQPLDSRVRLEVTPVSEGLARQLGESRTLASLAGTFAAVALCLAIVGLHGVTAFVINQRSQEITLRVALGATRRDVVRMLLGDSLRPVVLGLGAGIFVAVGAGRLIAGTLYGIGPADPIAFGVSVLILVLSTMAAIIVPARRAAAVDPATVLRQV